MVTVAQSGPRALPLLALTLGWHSYVVAAIALEGKTVGLLHATRTDSPPLDDLDLDVARLYASGLGQAFERAVLRDKLQRQHRQLQAPAMDQRPHPGLSAEQTPSSAKDLGADGAAQLAELSRRGTGVSAAVGQGPSIARSNHALLREGTVEYHVKNILRKLQSRSRTEAVSRYMQLQAGSEGA